MVWYGVASPGEARFLTYNADIALPHTDMPTRLVVISCHAMCLGVSRRGRTAPANWVRMASPGEALSFSHLHTYIALPLRTDTHDLHIMRLGGTRGGTAVAPSYPLVMFLFLPITCTQKYLRAPRLRLIPARSGARARSSK